MVDKNDDTIRANSKAFIYKLEVMEFAIETAIKGLLQDDKGCIFCLETRDADVTRVLLARILRSLSKEAILKQNLDEIFTDFGDFTRMSDQQNNDWTSNSPNLLICKVECDEQLDEQPNILKSWVNIVKDKSKKIIFIVENSNYLEEIILKFGMANFMNIKFTELWEQNKMSIKYNANNCKNTNDNQAKIEQDLENNHSARALDEDINVKKRPSSCKRSYYRSKVIDYAVPVNLSTFPVEELDTIDVFGNTRLHRAAFAGRTEEVNNLLFVGAKKEIKNPMGKTELHLAAGGGHLAIVNILLEQGANVNATDKYLKTPLHISSTNPANNNNAEAMVDLLLKFGAEIEKKDADGETPLHVAATNGHIEKVISLLQHRAIINAQANNGRTPLHAAAASNQPEVVLKLLQKGANFNIKDIYHKTPLDIARDRNDTNLIKIFKEHAGFIKNPR